jgi:hypothetical protein
MADLKKLAESLTGLTVLEVKMNTVLNQLPQRLPLLDQLPVVLTQRLPRKQKLTTPST